MNCGKCGGGVTGRVRTCCYAKQISGRQSDLETGQTRQSKQRSGVLDLSLPLLAHDLTSILVDTFCNNGVRGGNSFVQGGPAEWLTCTQFSAPRCFALPCLALRGRVSRTLRWRGNSQGSARPGSINHHTKSDKWRL